MENTKQERILEIFFRAMLGEAISVQGLANEYGVSKKSVTRDINDLKAFFADHRSLVGNTELRYSYKDKCYYLHREDLLTKREIMSLVEIVLNSNHVSAQETQVIVEKLKKFLNNEERQGILRTGGHVVVTGEK